MKKKPLVVYALYELDEDVDEYAVPSISIFSSRELAELAHSKLLEHETFHIAPKYWINEYVVDRSIFYFKELEESLNG